MKIKWRHRQHCEWSHQQHVLLYVIKWQMIRFQALWKTKSFVKVCLKFKLPLWTKGLLIHLSPLWQLPLWHFPRWHNFPVYMVKNVWPTLLVKIRPRTSRIPIEPTLGKLLGALIFFFFSVYYGFDMAISKKRVLIRRYNKKINKKIKISTFLIEINEWIFNQGPKHGYRGIPWIY